MNIKNDALAYAKQGFRVFPVHYVLENGKCSCGHITCTDIGKHPTINEGHKKATTDEWQIKKWWEDWPNSNIGVLAEGLFILDVDEKSNGYDSFRKLTDKYGNLPETVSVNTGGGGKHYYFSTEGIDIYTKSKIGFKDGLDVRSNNGYVVAPPSNHVSGGTYQFEEGKSPGKIEIAPVPQWLVDESHSDKKKSDSKKTKAKKKVNLSQKIQPGTRHSTFLSIASKYRNQDMSQDIAYMALKGVNEASTEEPLTDSELNEIVEGAYNYSDDTFYIDPTDGKSYFDDRYVLLFFGSRFVVWEKETRQQRELKGLCDYHNNYVVKVKQKNSKTGEEETKYHNAFRYWYNKTSQRYMDMVFLPGEKEIINDQYNLWNGFAYEGDPEGNCDLYLNHIFENICSSDQKLYDFVLDWMAQIIQEPHQKTGVALALRGIPGTGKGIYAHTFGELLGSHYLTVNNIEMLTRNFNAHLLFKLLIFSDEAVWGGDKKSENILKNFITEPREMIEKKGVDAVEVDSYKRLLMSTNNDWVAPVDNNDRRYVIIDVAENHVRDRKYFGAILTQMKNERGFEKIIYLLMNRDISERDWSKLPMTKARMENILRSFSPVQKWFYQNLQEGEKPLSCEQDYYLFDQIEKWGEIQTQTVFDKFQRYNASIHKNNHIDHSQVGKHLQRMVPSLSKYRKSMPGKRPNVYIFPSLEKCREEFCKFIDFQVEWD